eukprot:1154828-Pelagomonas_calceolata.AAC.4
MEAAQRQHADLCKLSAKAVTLHTTLLGVVGTFYAEHTLTGFKQLGLDQRVEGGACGLGAEHGVHKCSTAQGQIGRAQQLGCAQQLAVGHGYPWLAGRFCLLLKVWNSSLSAIMLFFLLLDLSVFSACHASLSLNLWRGGQTVFKPMWPPLLN